jgi:hypothetical protein
MALDPQGVKQVEDLFTNMFADIPIEYTDRNNYGAEQVFVNVRRIQTRQLHQIITVSKQIGNTVDITTNLFGDGICICFF